MRVDDERRHDESPPSSTDVLRAETFRLVDQAIDEGSRPVLLCFMNAAGEVSTFSRDVDLAHFLEHLRHVAAGPTPSSRSDVVGH